MVGKLAAPLRWVNRRCGLTLRLLVLLGGLLLMACPQSPSQAPPPRPSEAAVAARDAFRRPRELVAALAIREGQTVVEIGAGGGFLTLHLARAVGPHGRVVATDIDEAALHSLRERARELPQITTRLVRPDETGLEVGRYDLIVLADVVHLLPRPGEYLPRLFAALSTGGRIVVVGRLDRRAALARAAEATQLSVVELPIDLPAQFVVELKRPTTF